jgi:hypothetical protein
MLRHLFPCIFRNNRRPEYVNWTGLLNMTNNGNGSITKTSGGVAWNAGGRSTQSFSTSSNFYVEFQVSTNATQNIVCGFTKTTENGTGNFADIDFAIYLHGTDFKLWDITGGSLGSERTAYLDGDTFRVEINGGVVTAKRNGTVFYTFAGTASGTYVVDTSMESPNHSINNCTVGYL